MRLICSIGSEKEATRFSLFLTKEEISHKCEAVLREGDIVFQIWIIDENDTEKASEYYSKFQEDPNNSFFDTKIVNFKSKIEKHPKQKKRRTHYRKSTPQFSLWKTSGKITLFILLLCLAIFIWDEIQSFGGSGQSITYSTSKKILMYDHYSAYDVLRNIAKKYSIKKPEDLKSISPEDQKILNELNNMPAPWQGIYVKIVSFFRPKTAFKQPKEIMFNKISQGQIWRLFTPCLLHGFILHLLFNMSWLLFLGNQLELRMGIFRYLIFIILSGIVANTSQYIMSGDQFLGFSGVICGMIAFIWIRQKEAPWEGYFMPHSVFVFVSFFILIFLGVQMVSFVFEIAGKGNITMLKIGNTAHLSGAAAGAIMAKIPFFSFQKSSRS